MTWHPYVAGFCAGAFLANFVPHFVHGISGDQFPTPFANPPGKGLSSPTVNVLWGLLNLVVGFVLFRTAGISTGDNGLLLAFLAGITLLSVPMSIRFSHKAPR